MRHQKPVIIKTKKKKENLQPFLNKAYSAIFLGRAKAACYGRVAVATTLVG